jgi:hypothetical protein
LPCTDSLTNAFVLIGVVNRLVWISLLRGHIQGAQDQFGAQVVGHCPSDNASAESIEHDSKVQKAGLRRHVGDVRYPQLIGPLGGEVPIDQVWERSFRTGTDRRRRPFSAAYAA